MPEKRSKPAKVTFPLAGQSTTVTFPTTFSNGDIAATIKNMQSQSQFGEQANQGGLLKAALDWRVAPSVGSVAGGILGGGLPGAGLGALIGSEAESLARSISGIDPPLTGTEAAIDIGTSTAAEIATDLVGGQVAKGAKAGFQAVGKRFAKQVPPEARVAEQTLRAVSEEIGLDIGLTPSQATKNTLLDIMENIGEGAFFGGKLVRFKDMTQLQMREFADDFVRRYFQLGAVPDAELGRQLSKHIGTKSAGGSYGGGVFNIKQVAIGKARSEIITDIEEAGATRFRFGELLELDEGFTERMLKDSNVVDPLQGTGLIEVPGTARRRLPGPRGGVVGTPGKGLIVGEFGPPTISMREAIEKLRPRVSREIRALKGAKDRGLDLYDAQQYLAALDKQIVSQITESAGTGGGAKLARSLQQTNRLFRGSFQRFDHEFIKKAIAASKRGDPQKFWQEFLQEGADERIQLLKKAVLSDPEKGRPIWQLFQSSTLQGFVDDSLSQGGEKLLGDRLRHTLFGIGTTESGGLGKKTLERAYGFEIVNWLDDFVNALQVSQKAAETGVGRAAIQFAQIAQIAALAGAAGVGVGNLVGFRNETLNKGALFTAGAIVLGPAAIARLMTHPTGRKLLIDGVLEKSPVNAARIAARLSLLNSGLYEIERQVLDEILPPSPEKQMTATENQMTATGTSAMF